MTAEDYQRWQPASELRGELTCEAVRDDYEGFRIIVRVHDPSVRTVRISFSSVIGYRNVNESYRTATWSRSRDTSMVGVFRVIDSHWVAWLQEESGGVLEGVQLGHYAVFTEEDCIDVVSEHPPVIEWLDD